MCSEQCNVVQKPCSVSLPLAHCSSPYFAQWDYLSSKSICDSTFEMSPTGIAVNLSDSSYFFLWNNYEWVRMKTTQAKVMHYGLCHEPARFVLAITSRVILARRPRDLISCSTNWVPTTCATDSEDKPRRDTIDDMDRITLYYIALHRKRVRAGCR